MPSSIIFLGPSLEQETARQIYPNATYLPPIKRGDVNRILTQEIPDAIGIIDGQFFQQFSISPKEILKALNLGIRVYGASSMGVLRAIELNRYGMKGVGDVFELYYSGTVDADDEVAVIYDGNTQQALSVPMVNMRLAFRKARSANYITSDTEGKFVNKAKSLFYPDRTYERVLKQIANQVPQNEIEQFKEFLYSTKPNAKRDDAITLLKLMKEEVENAKQK